MVLVEEPVDQFRENNICISVAKTKEMIVDFRRRGHIHLPLFIGMVATFTYLGLHIPNSLKWTKVWALNACPFWGGWSRLAQLCCPDWPVVQTALQLTGRPCNGWLNLPQKWPTAASLPWSIHPTKEVFSPSPQAGGCAASELERRRSSAVKQMHLDKKQYLTLVLNPAVRPARGAWCEVWCLLRQLCVSIELCGNICKISQTKRRSSCIPVTAGHLDLLMLMLGREQEEKSVFIPDAHPLTSFLEAN